MMEQKGEAKMETKQEAVCYEFVCSQYPKCRRARGKGCSVEWDDTPENQILPGQCTRENGYPFFLPQK